MTSSKSRVLLGIDPGSNLLGYAFLDIRLKAKPRIVSVGTLDMRSFSNHGQKLAFIFKELQKLIKLYQPTEAAIEAPFYGKNVQSMLKLGRAQGVAMVAVSETGINIEEYAPKTVKRAVTGKGSASKEQVARMLPHLVEGELNGISNDASDALAVAFCHHIQTSGIMSGQKKHKDWSSFLKDNPGRETKF